MAGTMSIRIAGRLVADAEAQERRRCLRVAKRWTDPEHIKLHCGEMTAQELRTAVAVAKAIATEIDSAR